MLELRELGGLSMTKDEMAQLKFDDPVVVTCYRGKLLTGKWRGYGKVGRRHLATVSLDDPPDPHRTYCHTGLAWMELPEQRGN